MSFISDLSTREPKLVQFLLKRWSPLKEPAGSANSQSSSYALSVRFPKQSKTKPFIHCRRIMNRSCMKTQGTRCDKLNSLDRLLVEKAPTWLCLYLNLSNTSYISHAHNPWHCIFACFAIEDRSNLLCLCPYNICYGQHVNTLFCSKFPSRGHAKVHNILLLQFRRRNKKRKRRQFSDQEW